MINRRNFVKRHAIRYVTDPSEEIQLAAVENDGLAIQQIKNPTEQVQLAAVKTNTKAVVYIDKKVLCDSVINYIIESDVA